MPQLKLIGVCLSTIHENDRFMFVNSLNKFAVENGYRIIVFNSCADLYEQTPQNNEAASSVFRLITYEKLSALILFPNIIYDNDIVDEIVKNCCEMNIPIISIDKEIDGCISFSFSSSNAFEQMCRHVIEYHGARDIIMMAGFRNNIYSNERIEAFKRVLQSNNIPFTPDNISYGCFWETPTLDEMKRLFIAEKRRIPDAVICANDFMAITVSGFLQEIGVRIPEDCIVTGFDGIPQIEYLPPVISTCRQDFDHMAEIIIDAVNKIINGEKTEKSYTVDFTLSFSESCGCKPVCYDNVRHSIHSLQSSIRLFDERHKMVLGAQSAIPKITDFNYLPRNIINKFRFDTCVLAVNENLFAPPDFGNRYKNKNCFSENINIVYQKYNKIEAPQCKIPVKNLLPRFDIVCENEAPVILCCASFTDMIMGYAAFQPEIDIDEYRKIHSIMGTIGSALGSFHNRMQIKSFNSELRRLSQCDFMTGLLNRRGFFSKLQKLLDKNCRCSRELVLISADLDGLKYINDNFGHAEGDNAIITVGKALADCCGRDVICARFGGDEFSAAAVVSNNEADMFYNVFRTKFFNFLAEYNRTSGKEYSIRASIGYSHAEIDGIIDTDIMIKLADEKMYSCKTENKLKNKNLST